jgi:ABC-type multidrug transport system ATPase subunit
VTQVLHYSCSKSLGFNTSAARRSISGGEKRRVSIACELVTSPSILFLDEPTSGRCGLPIPDLAIHYSYAGLDAFNALNVVESLVALARKYHRTVIFTIHQPRSNIVSLLDRLVVLAQGKMVYSGPSSECHEYFVGIGRPCPIGFNIADFLSASCSWYNGPKFTCLS